jgi:alpha-tubulin suppressor-like RCC1 family protein
VLVCGRAQENEHVPLPTLLAELRGKRIHHIAAGWKHSLAVGRNGKKEKKKEKTSDVLVGRVGDVYAWGWGYATGHGEENVQQPRLIKVLALHRVLGHLRFVATAGGNDFTLALSEQGTVWSFGENSNGQLGVVTEDHVQLRPRLILALNKVFL